MSVGKSDNPLGVTAIYQVPEQDGRHIGVVFYRLREDELPRANAKSIVRTIATSFAQMGPYTVCAGFRPDEGGTYWVGFNHASCGASFEGALRAVRRSGVELHVSRRSRLPGDKPNPELKPVLNPGEMARLHAEYAAAEGGNEPSPPAPKEKVEKVSPFQLMRAKRDELGGTSLAQRFKRGARGRRARGDQDGDQQS